MSHPKVRFVRIAVAACKEADDIYNTFALTALDTEGRVWFRGYGQDESFWSPIQCPAETKEDFLAFIKSLED